ncbi:MFS general substrate transporter [Saitoella complicata NRRL Y-17804]|nr:MFS general substrate transporter [Saitoella complicata NRRL Y-17804]ODQ55408.1 MFS general substrate transporter [Saitoella complicata NRRL Y-17804]
MKKLVRKIDFTIVPLLALTYFLQFLDKTTLSYTSVMGLQTDTHLKGDEYSYLGMLFYVGFLVTELPTQWLAQKVSHLAKYLAVNIMLWGVVLSCHAACTNFAQLAVLRTLLGVFEACVAPILVMIISMWYKKSEQGRRVSFFYVMNSLTSIVGGFVAYGVTFTHSHFASWRIFYLALGLFTVACGVLVFIFLPDSPVRASGRRFSDREKRAALLRIADNQSGTQNKKLKVYQMKEALVDVKTWLIFISVMLTSIPNGALSNFNSIIIKSFGFTSQQTLILGTPAGLVGIVFVLGCGWLSDRLNDRSLVMLIFLIPTILGAALMVGLQHLHNKAGLLAANYLTGTFGGAFGLILAWNASNISGHSKKVVVNAMTLVSFATGNIIGTQTFRASDAPDYIPGKTAIIVCLGAQVVVSFALRYVNIWYNKKKARVVEGMDPATREATRKHMAFADETDMRNPFFKYTN